MISNLVFWRNWPAKYKFLFFSISLILSGLLLISFWAFLKDSSLFFHWDVASVLQQKFISKEAFTENGLTFSNNELVYFIKEHYLPGKLDFNADWATIYFYFLILGLSLLLASLSQLPGRWFFLTMLVLAGFLLSIRIENVLQDPGNRPFLILFLLLACLLYYFNTFGSKIRFISRWIAVFGVFVALASLANNFSKIPLPFLSMSAYGLYFALAIFTVFVFFIAHEGIALIVWLISYGSEKGKSSLNNYLIAGSFYLINCLMVYLENIRAVSGSPAIISPYFLYLFSLIAGIWGFRKMIEDTDVLSFRSLGVWLYLGMAIISTALLSYSYFTANDSLTELLIDIIAISHLVMGFVFFIHVLINFISLFKQGLNVFLVMYKPKLSRLILARIFGIILIAFFLIQKNIYSWSQLQAASNNAIADYYFAVGEYLPAETFYKEATHHDLYNHKSNASLAALSSQLGDGVNAAFFFKQALVKNPSEYAYMGMAENLEKEDLFFDALFTLREGLGKFPKSHVLATNLARLMNKSNNRDSTYIYLEKAFNLCGNCETESVNLQAFWIENALTYKLDSVTRKFAHNTNESNLANQLAINRMSGSENNLMPKLPKKGPINVSQFAVLYNGVMENKILFSGEDSLLQKLAENYENQSFVEDLHFLEAEKDYAQNNKMRAIKQLTYLSQDTTATSLMYRRRLGLKYLQEGVFDRAVQFLKAGGDASSAEVLEKQGFKEHLRNKQNLETLKINEAGITKDNYYSIYQEHPFNSTLLLSISDFLEKNKQDTKAYQLVFDALEFNDSDPGLWKKQVMLAIKLGVNEYAKIGVDKLKNLLTPSEYSQFYQEYQSKLAAKERQAADFQ